MTQPDRLICLELFAELLDHHTPAVRRVSADLANAVIAAVDGEKDPRCLVIAFRLLSRVAELFADEDDSKAWFGDMAEDLFDVAAAYFPVSFTPPANDRTGITREALATLLEDCLCATSAFVPHLVPLLLQKMSSLLPSAKTDSLRCMSKAVGKFRKALAPFWPDIWVALKEEVLPEASPPGPEISVAPKRGKEWSQVKLAAMDCLTECARLEYGIGSDSFFDVLEADVFVGDFLAGMTAGTVSSHVEGVGAVLGAAGRAGALSFSRVVRMVDSNCGLLLGAGKGNDCFGLEAFDSSERKAAETVAPLLAAILLTSQETLLTCGQRRSTADPVSDLDLLGGRLVRLFAWAASQPPGSQNLNIFGLVGIRSVVELPAGAPASILESDLFLAADFLVNLFLTSDEKSTPLELTQALVAVASPHSTAGNPAMDRVVDSLASAFRVAESGESFDIQSALQVIRSLAEVSPAVLMKVAEEWVDFMAAIWSQSLEVNYGNFWKLPVLLGELSTLFSRFTEEPRDQSFLAEFIHRIWTILSTASLAPDQTDKVLVPACNAVRSAMQKLTKESQQKVLAAVLPAVTLPAVSHSALLTALLSWMVIGLRQDVLTRLDPLRNALLHRLITAATSSNAQPWLSTSAAAAVASMVNKAPDADLDELLDSVLGFGRGSEQESGGKVLLGGGADASLAQSLEALGWVGRGLAMRGSRRVSAVVAMLLQALQQEGGQGVEAARAFGTMAASDSWLDKPAHCRERPLYQQKLFCAVMAAFHGLGRRQAPVYLAFALMVKSLPPQVILAEMDQAAPWVLTALEVLPAVNFPTAEPLQSLLLSLSSFLMDGGDRGKRVVSSHLPAVIKRLVALAGYEKSAAVRELSLQCLILIGDLGHVQVYPHAREVLTAVNVALDDTKRRVRREAVKCKKIWSSILR